MTFKDFMDKYLGMIIGVIVALILIAFNLVEAVLCIALIVGCAYLGKYVQKNKSVVKDKLKSVIDKM